MKEIVEQSGKSRDFINLLILLTVALCVGVYLIVTTAIIAKDGVTFIKYAQQFESAPVATMVNEFQHPGYPWLIFTMHKMTGFLHADTSILSWIYCGQGVALIFRLLALVILYFIGKHLFGARMSFWAILILILLPKPAEYGSDALSDWPHLCFLSLGLLLLFNGAVNKRWWIFGFAGVAAGAGYLIRPECAMLVVLGGLWLGLQFLWSKRSMSKVKALSALAVLLVGFLAVAGPYMKFKGAVFPKKRVGQFALNMHAGEIYQPQQQKVHIENNQIVLKAAHISEFTSSKIGRSFYKLASNMGETLMWFFVPALLIGMFKRFKVRKWYEPEKFFIVAIIVLNVPVMVWLYCRYGYMSDRHTLPLLILPILYVPVGLQELAIWFQKRFSKEAEPSAATNQNERLWFLILFVIGISICAPKLFRPIRIEKQGYRAAAKWLKANTDIAEIIAVPDKRISFYAQREEVMYKDGHIPANVVYTVMISKSQKGGTALMEPSGQVEYKYVDKTRRGVDVIIYRSR